MKSCLKCSTRTSHVQYPHDPESPSDSGSDSEIRSKEHKHKSVSFIEEGEEEVFYVDDWDRSPAAVTERLTYKDVYELKELRISLPKIGLATRAKKAKCV